MTNSELLDDHQIPIEDVPVKVWRPLAILLEVIPMTIIFLGCIMPHFQVVRIGSLLLVAVYIFSSWYLFKGEKFRVWDIIIVQLAGIFSLGIHVIIIYSYFMGIPFNGEIEAVTISNTSILPFGFILFIKFFFHSLRPLEWRVSLKVLLRIIVFALLANALA